MDGRALPTGDLPAGDFSTWLAAMEGALGGGPGTDVPCDGCTACCRASQFVPIAPEESDTLAWIPPELLVPAPGLPRGHAVLGYDERGRCPLLVDDRCSIYEHRPRACRVYDCRIFPAAGVEPDDDPRQADLAARTRRWRFSYSTPAGHAEHDATRAAAAHLREHPEELPDGERGLRPVPLAVTAVEIHRRFVTGSP
jgi:Fe-S-cluster containining protein